MALGLLSTGVPNGHEETTRTEDSPNKPFLLFFSAQLDQNSTGFESRALIGLKIHLDLQVFRGGEDSSGFTGFRGWGVGLRVTFFLVGYVDFLIESSPSVVGSGFNSSGSSRFWD